jgi:predicted enzyme related to lactoylglutathione lyase
MADDARPQPPRWTIAPYFIVNDVVSTANYYRDMLGFDFDRLWGEPPAFCMVKRSGIIIMLSQSGVSGAIRPNHCAEVGSDAWDAYIWVDDVDALHAEFASRNATIARKICDQPYGCRDFDVEDCNGYRLCFGQPVEA